MLASLGACSGGEADEQSATTAQQADAAPAPSEAISTAKARLATNVPLGTVPGQITLPPEARVAVTSPFPGAAVRVYVIEGQAVARGAPLAIVRAAEPVSISADLARARSEAALAEAQSARLEQLASEGIIAQARADEAAARLAQARTTVVETQRLNSYSGVGPDGMMTLRSPISGRVAHVGVETGGPVDGMVAPFVIEASGSYQIDLQLPERLAGQVRPGMGVELQLPAGDGQTMQVGGRILSVAPSIDPVTRSVMAKASIGAAPGLVPGGNVMVVITGSGDGEGVAIPSSAVTRIGGTEHVFVRTGDGFVPRPVTLVSAVGGEAIISAGLEPGETVATSGITELKAAAAE
ncbi:efflux RND transporter periplasmic adaptor subunit [Alteraurantiacibacter aestuarii]|uniref:Efflux RND transporter periplasmic adaptor subunit n=1 Tax=Alteraurantiacibacter aestuarii TaxID=650004 RepID=A0A844ZM04_9SPHN|nr:efflux RND transporter periplasmic adaptor subunit [Alteraurantiacibacter aestuarii]MXO88136.1 efflux RND transporter periplasmic adaptor subunit [Alteraurantiacibacter aestuarii]